MKKHTNKNIEIPYPFTTLEAEPPFYCKCKTYMRHSNLHNRNYKVSIDDPNFIISTKSHVCVKKNIKESKIK